MQELVFQILISVVLIILAAKLGAWVAAKIGQPEVLGEIVAGVILGNIAFPGLTEIKNSLGVEILASLGVILLLFEVGLETKLHDMMQVGIKSFIVACVGVIVPFVLGYYVSGYLLPELPDIGRVFAGATLTATSVGITARVFKDLNFTNAIEARIVLGAAVIDDVLGLIILAIVSGVAATGEINYGSIGFITFKALLFVVLTIVLGKIFVPKLLKSISAFKIPGIALISALALCFISAYLAGISGLAAIVGAFCIGLVLEENHFSEMLENKKIQDTLKPISLALVPIFFVATGMKVNLQVFMNLEIVKAALIITAAAILGKIICGWSFKSKEALHRSIIGVGMIPRGEVGLIFVTVGKSIGVVDDNLYAITVIMVILTTLIAPPLLSVVIHNVNPNSRS